MRDQGVPGTPRRVGLARGMEVGRGHSDVDALVPGRAPEHHQAGGGGEREEHADRGQRSGRDRSTRPTGQIVVLSSMSEGLPYTVIEAMMCKRPVVATDVGGIAEAVGGAGIIVPPHDPVALAAACVELLYDPERRRRLGELAARRSRAKFRVGQVTGSFRAMYAALAPNAAHRRAAAKFRHRGAVRYRARRAAVPRVRPRWAVARKISLSGSR